MCWVGKETPVKVKKGEQVNVVKIVCVDEYGKFIPYFIKHGNIKSYEIGKTYIQDIEKEVILSGTIPCQTNTSIKIYKGIHSYLAKNVIVIPKTENGLNYNASHDYKEYLVEVKNKIPEKDMLTYLQTYVYSRYKCINQLNHLCLLSGHLPPETTYYINRHQEIVSDKLVVDNITPFYWYAKK